MVCRIAAALAVAWLWLASPALAEPANPVLVAKDYFSGGDAEAQDKALHIASMDVEVAIVGSTARTVVVTRFDNPTDRPLEGDFTLALPANTVVTGYALDVEGRMLDGVLVGRRQGVKAYEEKVRQGVDPGLAEVTRSETFHTRVFPVLPGKGRTVRVEFISLLSEDGYVLPLSAVEPVGSLTIRVRTDGAAPKLIAPNGLTFTSKDGEAVARAEKATLAGALSVQPGRRGEPALLTRHHAGDTFFEIDDVAKGPQEADDLRRVRIYWDTSLSRRDDDLAAEIALLRRYLDAVTPETIDLVLFADGEPVVKSYTSAAEVEAALRAVRYLGATSIQRLFRARLPRASACLYFSDGQVTLDPYRADRVGCPLLAVSSARDADRQFLGALARKSGGEHVDLTNTSADQALSLLTRAVPRVASVTTLDGQDVDYRVLPSGPGRFRIVGRAPLSGQVRVRLVGAWNGVRTYDLTHLKPLAHDGDGALWAYAELSELGATDQPDEEAMLRLARRFSVASPAAVFLVLEAPEDYVEAGVEPPRGAGSDFLQSYKDLAQAKAAADATAKAERLDGLIEDWEAEKGWWRTKFPTKPRPWPIQRDPRAPPAMVPAPPPPAPASMDGAAGDGTPVEALIVTAQRREENIQDVPIAVSAFGSSASQISVEIEPWSPDRPYLKALAAASPETFWSVYDAEERAHGDLPAFYLDVGEFLFRAGRADDARTVTLGALEVPAADVGTLEIVADRMMRYGDSERALWLYERVKFLEADRPQPTRNLALALIERVEKGGPGADARRDYPRALALLSEVVLTPWESDYDGVELIALMEANRLIPRMRALGIDVALDPRLIALLDVDLRVVIDWNTAATDMDLWVLEPTGEQAMYSRPLTTIGGHMSKDMTRGYGPEEYLLRKAPGGRYEVRVNVFNVDRLNPNGATRVRAHLFRNWGRADEREEILEIELTKDEDANVLVGAVTVGGK